jgi:hypothetical protein
MRAEKGYWIRAFREETRLRTFSTVGVENDVMN